jgi:YD repeat-containing protein
MLRSVNGVPGTFETRFEYNGKRQVTRVVYPDGSSVDYNHSPAGMLQSIPGYIDAIDYGPTGLRERIRFANGLETRRHYTPGDYLINEGAPSRLAAASATSIWYTNWTQSARHCA